MNENQTKKFIVHENGKIDNVKVEPKEIEFEKTEKKAFHIESTTSKHYLFICNTIQEAIDKMKHIGEIKEISSYSFIDNIYIKR